MSDTECVHGCLARSCYACELQAGVASLEAELATLREKLAAWPTVTASHADGKALSEPINVPITQEMVNDLCAKLAAAEAEKDAVLAGEATWIRKAAEYNDKMRAERSARVQAEADLTAERQARERAEAERDALKVREDEAWAEIHKQAARNQLIVEDLDKQTSAITRMVVKQRDEEKDRADAAEAALNRARELLREAMEPGVDHGWAYRAASFLAGPANTQKEPT